jgi:hypothetical protein
MQGGQCPSGCADQKSCEECANADQCLWCEVDQQCHVELSPLNPCSIAESIGTPGYCQPFPQGCKPHAGVDDSVCDVSGARGRCE